ncbi:hypothetical protein BBJ28_00023726 [Nothophytophthora sp. Chile5]|nr:hypothetical protein BBJ28_00023726 [Nothophytophthora sp. Chile5]
MPHLRRRIARPAPLSTFSDANAGSRRRVRSLAASLALVATVGACWRRCDDFPWLLAGAVKTWAELTRLVFPSRDVTTAKVAWLVLGLLLASLHLRDWLAQILDKASRWRAGSVHHLHLVDECVASGSIKKATSILVTGHEQQRLPFENELFRGHLLLTIADGNAPLVGVQIQGRFRRAVPTHSRLFLALELAQQVRMLGFWSRVMIALAQKLWLKGGAHVSAGGNGDGDDSDLELPHVAFPLRSCAGQQRTRQAKHKPPSDSALDHHSGLRAGEEHTESYSVGKMYTFQFQSEHVDLSRWRLVNRLPLGLSNLPLGWFTDQPIRLAAYMISPPSRHAKHLHQAEDLLRHTAAWKHYLCCYSVHRQMKSQPLIELQKPLHPHLSSPQASQEIGSPIAMWNSKSRRGNGVPWAHAEACRRIAEDANALTHLEFSLKVWVEFVDRVAGRRKVGYLLDVVETPQQQRRTVLRSASTIKNALLLLRLEHQLDRDEAEGGASSTEDDDQEEEQDAAVDFRKVVVESREYLYEQIERETTAVAHVLERVALTPMERRQRRGKHQHCYQKQLEKAVLFRCLSAPSSLPSVPNSQSIGVHISGEQHSAMGVVCEAGVYRLHAAGDGAMPLLRQEWLVVTGRHLRFFRSFSVTADLRLPTAHVLHVCSVDRSTLLNSEESAVDQDANGDSGVPKWYSVEVHLVLEIITLFVESASKRDELVATLQRLTSDDCSLKLPTAPAESEAVAVAALFSPLMLDTQTRPVCLNQRTSCFVDASPTTSPLVLVQQSLTAGMELFTLGEAASRLRLSRAPVLRFLNAVEALNALDLDAVAETSHEERLALALNLYHTLFVHATLVFGYPQTHAQWKLIQTVPCYLVRVNHNQSVRFTLADIQRVMLRSPVPVTLEPSGLTRSFSQSSLLDLPGSGGDGANNGLRKAGVSVAWTPLLPNSCNYTAVGKTSSPIPPQMTIDRADFRTGLALQLNSSPPSAGSVGVMHVYDGGKMMHDQLDATCTIFLARELRLDDVQRVIYLPRVCEWYHLSHREDDEDDRSDESVKKLAPLTRRRRRSSSGSVGGVASLTGSRSFYCLQRLLGFMAVEQHHRVMHLLLGAGDECRFVFDEFWTRPDRSTASNLLSSAGAAALAAFNSASASVVPSNGGAFVR